MLEGIAPLIGVLIIGCDTSDPCSVLDWEKMFTRLRHYTSGAGTPPLVGFVGQTLLRRPNPRRRCREYVDHVWRLLMLHRMRLPAPLCPLARSLEDSQV